MLPTHFINKMNSRKWTNRTIIFKKLIIFLIVTIIFSLIANHIIIIIESMLLYFVWQFQHLDHNFLINQITINTASIANKFNGI